MGQPRSATAHAFQRPAQLKGKSTVVQVGQSTFPQCPASLHHGTRSGLRLLVQSDVSTEYSWPFVQ
ncbi:hypothetical protein GGTG_09209 [Gaeumannomyces tritici R3-111a-1]|uniref:Uncharacterized protein n=1 Tax=Gaeumannomyces tritici (strain R3-111a-1) TaxID=644352 RepID=J3P6R7_GAET3|nr:hypothetical protein GGTG_09209 [Gaeumannomyces tritici R3-111a-1]EJT72343.1 hypothetical protein GGTG_09209 [Gaeumannomyces tritici R3-111a-1]